MKTRSYTLIIHYTNGSSDELMFDHYHLVRDAYQNRISYTGNRVQRVEVQDHDGSMRAIWDSSWDEVSKTIGLNR
jgi:hypothetical protein